MLKISTRKVSAVEKLCSVARKRLISEKRLVLFMLLMCVDFLLPFLMLPQKAITSKEHHAHIRLHKPIVSITAINVKFTILIPEIFPAFIPAICGCGKIFIALLKVEQAPQNFYP